MRPGTLLLVLFLAVLYLVTYSRSVFQDGGPPAFFLEERKGVTVMLGAGFPLQGIHQFNDGVTPLGVIEMTELGVEPEWMESPASHRPLLCGESLSLRKNGREVFEIVREWMPASHRMTLGIPLHPDRMTARDWQALPGIGPKLAARIEMDRQVNGDFGSLEALDRVRGVGPSRLKDWKVFF